MTQDDDFAAIIRKHLPPDRTKKLSELCEYQYKKVLAEDGIEQIILKYLPPDRTEGLVKAIEKYQAIKRAEQVLAEHEKE